MKKLFTLFLLISFLFISNINSSFWYDFIQKSLRQNSTAVAPNDPVTASKWNSIILDLTNIISDIWSLKAYIDSNINTFFVETATRLEQTTHNIKIWKSLDIWWTLTTNNLSIPEWWLKDETILSKNIKNWSVMLEDLDPTIELWGQQVFSINGNNIYYNNWNVAIWQNTATEKLEVDWNIKLNTNWMWIIFPDGTKQTTAIVSSNDNVLLTTNQSISWLKKFLTDIALSNSTVKVNKLSTDSTLSENSSTSLISERALKEYINGLWGKVNGVCWVDNNGELKAVTKTTTESTIENKIYNFPNLTDTAKYTQVNIYRNPTTNNNQIIVDTDQWNDENRQLRSTANVFDFTSTPMKNLSNGWWFSVDTNDCRWMGSGVNLYQDDNNTIWFWFNNSASSWRSYSCWASCNDKNFGWSTTQWSCLSGSCWAWRWAGLYIKQNWVFWNYIYQVNSLSSGNYRIFNEVDFVNKKWKIVIKNYSNETILLDTTVNLPNPTNWLNLSNIKWNYKTAASVWRTCWSYSPNIVEPYPMSSTIDTVATTTTSNIQLPWNLCSKWNVSNFTKVEESIVINPKSCQDIKEKTPASTSWIYTIYPLWSALNVYCDMSTDWGWWTLVWRWREWWTWDNNWQNSANVSLNIWTTAWFWPATLSASTINAILENKNIKDLPDWIRLKRARNTTWTLYQEIRWKFSTQNAWNWWFNTNIPLASTNINGSIWNSSNTYDYDWPNNNYENRIFTWDRTSHNNVKWFAYWNSVTEWTNAANNFIWEYSSENHWLWYTEVYVRKSTPWTYIAPVSKIKEYNWSCNGISWWTNATCKINAPKTCSANSAYVNNWHTYNIPELQNWESKTLSTVVNENNWQFSYSLTVSCTNGSYTWISESSATFVSCDSTAIKVWAECKIPNIITWNWYKYICEWAPTITTGWHTWAWDTSYCSWKWWSFLWADQGDSIYNQWITSSNVTWRVIQTRWNNDNRDSYITAWSTWKSNRDTPDGRWRWNYNDANRLLCCKY